MVHTLIYTFVSDVGNNLSESTDYVIIIIDDYTYRLVTVTVVAAIK